MNKDLWDKISQFDFDDPPGEYGFSTRLANENYWTKDFTAKALLEYRKFMYLAATSDLMVSPSEIIDIVWHQHLIFTQSYQEFCALLGRQIQHIPSTHNREEFEKFKAAKERTRKLYLQSFGEPPADIWDRPDMYASLNLDKARLKLRTFIIIGILLFMLLAAPCYFLLRPVYVQIGNPDFIIGLILLTAVIFICLELFNRYRLKRIVQDFDKDSFAFSLQPLELVYLQTGKLSQVVNGVLNELVEKHCININADNSIEMSSGGSTSSIEQLQAMNSLNGLGKTYYPILLKQLATKPIFSNTANCMNAFKKYFLKSKKFGALFYFNFTVLAALLMAASCRLFTGILRDRPIEQITIAVTILAVLMITYLKRLTSLPFTETIPELYKKQLLSQAQIEGNWQWTYFLMGTAVLASAFHPLVKKLENSGSGGASGNCSTGCGSSCGSSCSSCGGCGGGD